MIGLIVYVNHTQFFTSKRIYSTTIDPKKSFIERTVLFKFFTKKRVNSIIQFIMLKLKALNVSNCFLIYQLRAEAKTDLESSTISPLSNSVFNIRLSDTWIQNEEFREVIFDRNPTSDTRSGFYCVCFFWKNLIDEVF